MAELNISDNITKLISLQEIDAEIFDIQFELEDFPKRISEIDALLDTKKTGMEEADAHLKQLQLQKNEKENEMQACEEKIKKHEGELALIKTNKEYSAMLEQIEGIRADISRIEEKILELFDSIEAAQARSEEEKKKFEDETRVSSSQKADINSEKAKLDSRLGELKNKRKDLLGGIDPMILQRYEKILENRGRNALSKIDGSVCGECNLTLRPQLINEAKLLNNIVTCENCSRILFTED